MRRYKFIVLVICLVLIIQFLTMIEWKGNNYTGTTYGQVYNLNSVKKDFTNKKIHGVDIRNLYSGSINIIEKYLTIYMILFIFSYYIRSNSIRI